MSTMEWTRVSSVIWPRPDFSTWFPHRKGCFTPGFVHTLYLARYLRALTCNQNLWVLVNFPKHIANDTSLSTEMLAANSGSSHSNSRLGLCATRNSRCHWACPSGAIDSPWCILKFLKHYSGLFFSQGWHYRASLPPRFLMTCWDTFNEFFYFLGG